MVRTGHQGVPSREFEVCPLPHTPEMRHLGRPISAVNQCSLWCRQRGTGRQWRKWEAGSTGWQLASRCRSDPRCTKRAPGGGGGEWGATKGVPKMSELRVGLCCRYVGCSYEEESAFVTVLRFDVCMADVWGSSRGFGVPIGS